MECKYIYKIKLLRCKGTLYKYGKFPIDQSILYVVTECPTDFYRGIELLNVKFYP